MRGARSGRSSGTESGIGGIRELEEEDEEAPSIGTSRFCCCCGGRDPSMGSLRTRFRARARIRVSPAKRSPAWITKSSITFLTAGSCFGLARSSCVPPPPAPAGRPGGGESPGGGRSPGGGAGFHERRAASDPTDIGSTRALGGRPRRRGPSGIAAGGRAAPDGGPLNRGGTAPLFDGDRKGTSFTRHPVFRV